MLCCVVCCEEYYISLYYSGLLLQMVSGLLVQRFGYDLLVTSVFIIYSIRLFGFSLVSEPRHLFLCEILKPFGNNLAMVLAAHFLAANNTGDNIATLEVWLSPPTNIIILIFYLTFYRDSSVQDISASEKLLGFLLEGIWRESLDTILLGDYFPGFPS